MTDHGATGAALSAALAAMPLGVWIIGADQRLAFANAATRQVTGIDPTDTPPGTPLAALLRHYAHRGLHGEGDPEALAAEHPRDARGGPFRRRFRRPDGTCFELLGTPLPAGGHVATAVEMTGTLAGTQAAEDRARRLEDLLAHLHAGVAAYDAQRCVLFNNPAYEALLGLPHGTLRPGTSYETLFALLAERGEFANVDAEALIADRRRIDRSRPTTSQRVRPNGDALRIESQPLPDGGYLVELIDISAARRAEAEARRRAALLDGVLDVLPHGVVVFDADGRVAMVNAAHQAIMAGAGLTVGEHREAVAARHAAQGEPAPGEATAPHPAAPHATTAGERTRPNGQRLDIRTAPLPDGGMVQVTTDITALHAARAEATGRAAQLQVMLDNIRHGIALYDADMRLVVSNQLANRLTGLPAGSMRPGRHILDLVREQAAHGVFGGPEATERALTVAVSMDRRIPTQRTLHRPDGSVVEVVTDPTPDGGYVVTFSDVTARARAQAAQQAQAATLQVALDSMRHGFILYDAEARVVAANALAADCCGLAPGDVVPGHSLAEVLGRQRAAGIYGAGAAAEATLHAMLALDRRQPYEARRHLPDGRVMEVRSSPIPAGGFVVTLTDITARAQAEAKAEQRAAVLQTALESMQHGFVLYDAAARLVAANTLGATYSSLVPADMVPGRPLAALLQQQREAGAFGPEPGAAARLAALLALDRRQPHEYRRPMPDGSALEIRSAPTAEGGFVITLTDITALARAEAAARERADLLQAMIDTMHHGVVLFGPDHRLIADNRLARELTGIPDGLARPGADFAELTGTLFQTGATAASAGRTSASGASATGALAAGTSATAAVVPRMSATGDPALDRQFGEMVTTADRSRPLHYTRPLPDGRTLEVFSDPMPDGGFVVSLSDITPLARAEAEAKQRAATQAVMLDVIRHGIALFGKDRRLVAVNRLASELSGVPADFMRTGMLYEDAVHHQYETGIFGSGEAAVAIRERALTADRTQTLRYHRRDPHGQLIEVVSDPTVDGGFAITYSDITAQAAAEAAAASRATTLQAALDNMRHGLLIYGPDRRLLAANALAAELSSLAPEDVVPGAVFDDLVRRQQAAGLFGPEPEATSVVQRLLAADRGRRGRRMRHLADGRQVEVFTDPTPDGGFVVSFTDITARALAEAQAKQRAAMLRDALDSMRHGLMLFGPDRRLLTANRLAGPDYGLPDLRGREGTPFETLLAEQARNGEFGLGESPAPRPEGGAETGPEGAPATAPEGGAAHDAILTLDRGRPLRYRRRRADGKVIEIGSDPTPDGGFVVTHTDVTELARAQDEATARAAVLQLMLDNMRHGIAHFDRDGRLVTANRLAAEFNGIDPSLMQPGVPARELALASLRAGMISAAAVQAGLADDYTRPHRRTRVRPDGRVIEIFTDPTPDGGFVATYSDVTALTEAEGEARERARILQVMLDNLRHGIQLFDADQRLVAANRLAADLTGYPAAQLPEGARLEDLIDTQFAAGAIPGDAASLRAMARSIDRTRPARYVRSHRDGRIIEVTSDPTPGGGFVITMADISALARAEAETQHRAAVLQAMLDNIRHGIALFDAAGRILAVNPVLLALLDLPEDVMRTGGSFNGFIDYLLARGEYGPGDEGRAAADRLKGRDRREPSRSTRTRPNGIVLEIASEPVPGGGFVLALTDVTEDRRIRGELEAAKDAAETANRTKSRFLATMSHELRTPLNAVIGFSEAISVDPDPVRGKEYVRSIHEAGRHLLSLIDDILDVTRAETIGFATTEAEVPPVPLLEGVVQMMQATAATAGVAVVQALPPTLPLLRADELRLRQVLLNLVSNAVKFTPQGGLVTVSAETTPEGGLVMRVTDSGIGIKPEDIPRAFEPFTQLNSSLSRRFPGSGLGLYLSRALAEAQGATLTLESEPGAGTTAVLRFPKSRLITPLAA